MAQVSTGQQPKVNKSKYIPGVCNIGTAERAKRRRSGVVATVAAIILLVILLSIGAPKGWRLLLIFPVSAAASGFLQDAFHFCAGFGMKGLYNVINSVGVTDNVTSEEFRLKDRRKSLQILSASLIIGIVVGVLSLL